MFRFKTLPDITNRAVSPRFKVFPVCKRFHGTSETVFGMLRIKRLILGNVSQKFPYFHVKLKTRLL